jgi:hypothetical protein
LIKNAQFADLFARNLADKRPVKINLYHGHKGATPLWFVLKNKDTRFNSCSGNKLPDMTHARSRVLLPGLIWVHAIHRCVRKAWLSMAFSYRRPLGTPGTSPASRHQQYGKKAEVC